MEELRNIRMAEQVAEQLAVQILSGRLTAGGALKQEELAAKLAVSRIPVREALQILVEQGLAYRVSTRHIYVADLHERYIQQIFSVFADIVMQALLECMDRETVGIKNLPVFLFAQHNTKNSYLSQLLYNANQYYLRHLPKPSCDAQAQLTEEAERIYAAYTAKNEKDLHVQLHRYFTLMADILIQFRRSIQ